MERSRTTSAILGSVHHISGKFPNVALFLRLGLSSKQILHENGAFRKCFTNWRNLEAFRFGVYGKHFKNGAFLLSDGVIMIMWLPLTEFIKHKSKMTGDFCVFFISPSYSRRKTFEAFSELKPPFCRSFLASSLIPGRETPDASLSVLISSGDVTCCLYLK